MHITRISSINNFGNKPQPSKNDKESASLPTSFLRKDIAILQNQLHTILNSMSSQEKFDYLTGKTRNFEIKEITDEIAEIRRTIQKRGESPY